MNIDYQFTTGMPSYSWIVPVLALVALLLFFATRRGTAQFLAAFGVVVTFVLTIQAVNPAATDDKAMTQAIFDTYKVGNIIIDEEPSFDSRSGTTNSQLYQLTIVNPTDNKSYPCRFTTISSHYNITKRFPEIQGLQHVYGQLLCSDSMVTFQHK